MIAICACIDEMLRYCYSDSYSITCMIFESFWYTECNVAIANWNQLLIYVYLQITNSLNCCITQFKNTLPSHSYVTLNIGFFKRIYCAYPNWVWCHWRKDQCWTLNVQCWCIKCTTKIGNSKRKQHWKKMKFALFLPCLLYTSDAADD